MIIQPNSLGIKTRLIAEYACSVLAEGVTLGIGGGKAVIKVLKAVAGMDVSTELIVFMFESLCTKGANMSVGSLRTSAPTLGASQF